jgi:RHS repeat-associated protein
MNVDSATKRSQPNDEPNVAVSAQRQERNTPVHSPFGGSATRAPLDDAPHRNCGRRQANGPNPVMSDGARSATERLLHFCAAIILAVFLLSGAPAQAAIDITANAIGSLTSFGNDQTRTFFQYDARGRAVATSVAHDGPARTFTTEYGYSQNPQSTIGLGTVVIAQTFPDGERLTYTYDAGGIQVAVRSTLGSVSEDVVRDVRNNARGDVVRLELGNGTVTTALYNDNGDLEQAQSHTVSAGGVVIQHYEYGYDGEGNVTRMADGVRPDQSVTFNYDPESQLSAIVNAAGNVIEAYTYDELGNLIQKGALTQAYNAGGRPNAIASSGGVTYGYDLNGNVTSIGAGTTIIWTAENMAAKTTVGSVVADKSFVGESLWKKVEAGVTTYYFPSMRLENGVARKYYGPFAERLEQAGDRQLRFYHPDHLGSSSVMTDSSGNVIRRVSYLPWGQDRGVDASFTPKLQFNFKEKDATGFYDYGARLYNPATGRWLSPDTSIEDGPNRYAYVGNNPQTKIDPTGHQTQDPRRRYETPILDDRGNVIGWSCEDDCVRERRRADFVRKLDTTTQVIRNAFEILPGATSAFKIIVDGDYKGAAASAAVDVALGGAGGGAVRAIAPKFLARPGAVILGHYPGYKIAGKDIGARVFNVPLKIWNKMSPEAQWEANKKFLDRAVSRGVDILLSTDPSRVRAGSGLEAELKYLKERGYTEIKEVSSGIWKIMKGR